MLFIKGTLKLQQQQKKEEKTWTTDSDCSVQSKIDTLIIIPSRCYWVDFGSKKAQTLNFR